MFLSAQKWLALTGLILLLSRVVDTLQDPWLGRLADTLQQHRFGWKRLIGVAALGQERLRDALILQEQLEVEKIANKLAFFLSGQQDAVKAALSRNGRFVSVTVTITATSREQLDTIYREVTAHEDVLMAL